MKHKLRSRRGMTLTEVLMALLILSLVTVGMAAGIGASLRVYRQATETSDAQMLASTLSTALMDELRYARDISGTTNPTFTSGTFGENVSVDVKDGYVEIGGAKLLSDAAYAKLLVREIGETKLVSVEDDVFKVAFEVCNVAGNGIREVEFSVRALNAAPTVQSEEGAGEGTGDPE